MTAGERLAAAAEQWLGTPYRHNAKVRGVGVDCGRLAIGAAEDAGFFTKDSIVPGNYSTEWHLHRNEEKMLELVAKYCDEVPVTDMRRGDVLLFQYGRVCSHAGIYLGDGRVIHSYVERGTIISELKDSMFYRRGEHRLRHVFRLREE